MAQLNQYKKSIDLNLLRCQIYMMNAHARENMVSCQIKPNNVNDDRIVEAFAAIPREIFVPESLRDVAYIDNIIEVAPNRSMIDPMTLARMIEAADIKPTDLVLEIGCCSGYEAAVMARLADAVVALEPQADLVQKATKNLQEAGVDNVAVVEGQCAKGVKDQGPFQVIFINGGVEDMQQSLLDQLDEGGRMVYIKVDNGIGRCHILKKNNGQFEDRRLYDATAHVLPGFEKKVSFQF